MIRLIQNNFTRSIACIGVIVAMQLFGGAAFAQSVNIPAALSSSQSGAASSTTCVSGLTNTGWNVAGNYWQYSLNTAGYSSIKMGFHTSGSATGPNGGTIFYNIGGGDVSTGSTYTIGSGSCVAVGGAPTPSLALPAACNNITSLLIKCKMGSVAINGGAVGSAGTNRIDGSATSSTSPLIFIGTCSTPNVYTVSDASSCVGSAITLSSSDQWASYALENGATLEQTKTGTGAALTFTVTPVTGTYTILATNIASGCSATANMTGSVVLTNNVPSITTNPGSAIICSGDATSFIGAALGATTYQWQKSTTAGGSTYANITTGQDGGIYGSSFTTPTLTVTAPTISVNNFNYRLIAINTCGNSSPSTAGNLTVNTCSGNTITTTATLFGPYCNSTDNAVSVNYTTTGSYTGTFQAELSDPTGSFASPVVIGTGVSPISATIPASTLSGAHYRIRVTNPTPATIGTDNGNDIIISDPTVAGTAAASQAICSGLTPASLTLTGQTGAVVKWQSSTSSSFTSPTDVISSVGLTTLPGATIGALSITTYFEAVVQNGGCSVVNSNMITVTVNPIPSVAAISGGTSVVFGSSITLSDATTDVSNVWSSSNAGVASVGSSTGVVTGASVGTATISYSVTTAAGCTGVATKSVTVTYPYCAPAANSTGDIVGITTSGGSTNITTYSATGSPAFNNKTASFGVVTTPGSTVNYTITNSSTFNTTYDASIWIDWNQSTTFADSTSEQVLNSQPITFSGGTYSGSFTVPTTARGGNTVMRLSLGETSGSLYSNPCGTGFGDVVDFYVKILPAISVNPASTAVSESASASFSGTALAASSYQWQRGISGSYVNIDNTTDGGVYNNYTTSTLLIASAAAGLNGYTYRLVATNVVGNATSTAATLTVNVVPACSGTPNAGTASPSIISACGSTSSVITLNGGSANTGLTYQWSSSSVNTAPGTDIPGATNSVYNASAITATTYYWCTTTCTVSGLSNISSVGTVSITPTPIVTVTPAGGNYCSATSGLSMTASGATTYIWAPSTGLSTTTGATVLANSTTAVTYTITGTTAGCVGANTVTVNYFTTPSPTVTPTFLNACLGGATNLLTANIGAASPANASSGTVNLTSAGAASGVASSPVTVAGIPSGANITSAFVTMNFTSNFLGDYIINLIAPNGKILNLSNLEGIHGAGSFTNTVISSAVSTALSTGSTPFTGTFAADAVNGVGPAGDLSNVTSWSNLYSVPDGSWTLQAYNNSTFANTATLVSWSIAITYNLPTVTWSPVTDLYTNSGGTTPYAGTATTTVYENPSDVSAITYTAIANNNGCLNTATTTVTVNSLPTTAASNSGAACVGTDVTLNANAAGAATYSWHGPASYTSTAASPTLSSITTGMAGTYTVTVTNAGGCTATSTTTVTVNTLPTTIASNDGPACIAGTINLNANATGAIVYSWSGPLSYIATGATPSIGSLTTGNAGTYSVTVTSAAGCTATSSTNVTVNALPITTASNNGPACTGGTINLNANASSTSGTLSYSWSGPLSFTATDAALTISSLTTDNAGTYSVTITTPGSGCTATSNTTIVVNALPTTTASNDGPACIGGTIALNANASATSGTISYSWSGPLGFTATTATPSVNSLISDNAGTYSVSVSTPGSGCTAMSNTIVVVNALPTTAATNDGPACVGGIIDINANASAASGTISYSWSGPSGFTSSIAAPSISSLTLGNVGTYSVTVSTPGSGCNATSTTTIAVNTLSVSATNDGPACAGGNVNLSSGETGTATGITYAWSGPSGFSSTAGNPLLSGVDAAFVGVYTVTAGNTSSGCSATSTTVITVNPLPSAITGPANVCLGANISLIDTSASGTWSSSMPGVATVGSSTGIVSGVIAGTTTISYTLSTGCAAGTVINVYPAVVAITGTRTVCTGSVTNLSDATADGVWSNNNSNTLIDGSGNVTGVTAGTSVITYMATGGCYITTVVTVNPLPADITGSNSVCAGLTITLSDVTPGGTWSSTNTVIASVGATSRIVTGIVPGADTIVYALATGCSSSYNITVNGVSPILNNAPVCVGSIVVLNDTTGTGTWSSSLTAHATIGSSSGTVTGVATGTSTITYFESVTGCRTTATVTVVAAPVAISGNNVVCPGSILSLSDGTTGGSWDVDVNASVDGSGHVMGISSGVAIVSYSLGTGCMVTKTVAVATVPGPITGLTVCAGSTTEMTESVSGGTWTSGNVAIATIGSGTGIVTGVFGGTANISYATAPGTGCSVSATVTVQALAPIVGNPYICVGGTDTLALSDGTHGGTWSSSSSTITIDTNGLVTGIAVGTASVVYTVPSGCSRSVTLFINPAPSVIVGAPSMCVGSVTSLSDEGTGTWSSSYVVVATVGSSSGIVTGASAGTVTITYSTGPGCLVTQTVTVNANPLPIQGLSAVCAAATVSLSDATAGGIWSSAGNASVDGSGNVTGGSMGSGIISYILSTGCYSIHAITVMPDPSAILGTTTLCAGGTTTLSDTTSGTLSWASSNTSVATVSGAGIATGVSAGTATITYKILTGGCTVTTVLNVLPSVSSITGSSSICPGTTTTLTDASGSGTWASSNTSVATIGSGSGILTGIASGIATISYSASGASGCTTSKVVTINPAAAIAGASAVCVNSSISLTDATTGGAWSSANTAVGTISGSGVVSGISAGTVTISYTTGAGCVVATVITVNAIPSAILGALKVCTSHVTVLSDATTGGIWSSNNGNISIDASGNATGAGIGTATISYGISGCYATAIVTGNPVPLAIVGTQNVCSGLTTSLSDMTTGGTWSATGDGTIGSTGLVTGGGATGTVTISYILPTGCGVSTTATVNSAPTAILGNGVICVGSTLSLTDAVSGGVWSSSNSGVASVGSSSGILTGVAGGTATISYTSGSGCRTTAIATVSATIGAINGPSSVCEGATISLSDATTGGAWSSSNTAVGTISTGGAVSGLSVGTANITYTALTGCTRSVTITVNAGATPVSGATMLCQTFGTTLTDATTGGTWSSSNTLVATIGTGGVVTTNATYAGTTTISYATGGCVATAILTVNATPKPIQGVTSECSGANVTLTDVTTGGVWSSIGNATIVGSSGVLTAITAGTATVTYTTGTGCFVTALNTIYRSPSAILGNFAVCTAATTALSDTTAGALSWTSSNTSVATALNSGVVTGVAAGTTTITYKILTGSCTVTETVTVNASPVVSAISGPATISHGTPATLSDATAGGIWSSSNVGVISLSGSTGSTVTATAVITTPSASVIRYAVTNGFSCTTTVSMTISAAAAPPAHGGSTGVSTVSASEEAVALYPNPTLGTINIKADQAGTFYLYSLEGKSLGAYKINEGITSITLPNELATGIYMGRYVGDDGNTTLFRVVKQ